MWRNERHKKPYVRGWLWISALPFLSSMIGGSSLGGAVSTGTGTKEPYPQFRAVLQSTYRRGAVSKITGKPLVPLIDGILPSKLRGRERMAAKALK